MALTEISNSLKEVLNTANPSNLSPALQTIGLGDFVAAQKKYLYRKVPVTNSYNLSTVQCIALPDDLKCASILRAYARAGTAGTGEMTIAANQATPTTGQIASTPNGDIACLGTDAITDLDVFYEPHRLDVVELTLPVVSGTGVCAIPAAYTTSPKGIVLLLEAESLAGTLVSKMIVLANGSAPATGRVNMNVAKSQVQFAVADAVTLARVKIGVVPAIQEVTLLTSVSTV